MDKTYYQLNARLPLESKAQLEKVVEYYRAQVTIGRVSQGDVLQDLIRKAYEQIEKNN